MKDLAPCAYSFILKSMSKELTQNSKILTELYNSFDNVVTPLNLSFFVCTNKLLTFNCIFSLSEDVSSGDKRSIFDLPALLRLLCLEEGTVDIGMATNIFTDASNQICRILEWTDYIKRIVIFDLSHVKSFNESKFIELTSDNSLVLDESFLNCYKIFNDPGIID